MTYQIVSERKSKYGVRIRQPSDILPLLSRYKDKPHEHFIVVTLNGAHEVQTVRIASMGLVNRTLVHPREIFRNAIMDNAVAVIIAHNHPSGKADPSDEDRAVTNTLREASDIVGIRLLDHIIFGPRGAFYSFLEHGELS